MQELHLMVRNLPIGRVLLVLSTFSGAANFPLPLSWHGCSEESSLRISGWRVNCF